MSRLNGNEQVSLMNTGGFVEDDEGAKAVIIEAVVIFVVLMIFWPGGGE